MYNEPEFEVTAYAEFAVIVEADNASHNFDTAHCKVYAALEHGQWLIDAFGPYVHLGGCQHAKTVIFEDQFTPIDHGKYCEISVSVPFRWSVDAEKFQPDPWAMPAFVKTVRKVNIVNVEIQALAAIECANGKWGPYMAETFVMYHTN